MPTPADQVKHIYETVWNEYYTWNTQYDQDALQRLSRPYSRHHLPPMEKKMTRKPRSTNAASSSSAEHTCTIMDFFEHEPVEKGTIAFKPTLIATEKFPSYPPYHSCTPISRSILVGDDSHYMPFIPFSDDPSYDSSIDLDLYHYTAWQKRTTGPDEQHVVLETVRRLVKDHGLSYQTIDATKALPMQCYDVTKLLCQQDFPKWLPHALDLPPYTEPDAPSAAVDYFLEYFCSNLNCLVGFCSLHDGESVRNQVPKSLPPKAPYTKPADTVDVPCGANCFLHPPTLSNSINSTWTNEDRENLSLTLRYAPDTTPCDIAVICRKPCRETHRYQSEYLRVAPRPPKIRQPSQLKTRTYDDEKPNRFTPNMPCRHPGPCNASSDCECYKNKGHCHTQCGCNKTCVRRWKGCTCARSEKVCGTKKCSCFRANFECDPEVCLPCGARDEHDSLCQNVGIQKGMLKATEVRESQWGLGLFLAEAAEENDLISEYVGEMIRPLTVDSRNFHAEHRDRSYVFHLNPTYALDSVYAGNETRYMNHSEAPNCTTRVVLVNGEHRIGVYAARRMGKGEELLINYGTYFWKADRLAELVPALPLPPTIDDDPKDLTYEDLDSSY